MKATFDIQKLIKAGTINNALDFERAIIAEKNLRLLVKQQPELKPLRVRLRDLIQEYEKKYWSDENKITRQQLKEDKLAELIAEKEKIFIDTRKEIIKSKLKKLDLTQQDFGLLLGHKSKSHMSELMNGICPFTLKDIVITSILLRIKINKLIPLHLDAEEYKQLIKNVNQLNNPNVRVNIDDLILVK